MRGASGSCAGSLRCNWEVDSPAPWKLAASREAAVPGGRTSGDIVVAVTLDQVHAAVIAFLDQFIERRAAQDVVDLRQRLANDADARKLLDAAMPNDEPTEREAFDGMRDLLATQADRGGRHWAEGTGPDLAMLHSWTSWEDWDGKSTSDPAQWHDWLDAVKSATQLQAP